MHIKEIINKSLKEGFDIVFPKICIHCKKNGLSNNFFCELCLSTFDLLEKEDMKSYPSIKYNAIIAFDDIGPINTLYQELKKMALPLLAKVAASYMVCQFLKFEINLPDIVVPISENYSGINYTHGISREIGKLINRPIKKMFSQISIPFMSNFSYLRDSSLQDKKLLLVMTRIDEKKAMEAILQLEKKSFKKISILAFCQ
jgi:hypothetical protein